MAGRLAENIMHFVRILRAAGIPAGPERTLAAIRAVELVGVDRREDVHAALASVLLDRHEQQALFDAAFDTFWRDPKMLDRMLAALLPKISGRGREPERSRRPARLDEALAGTQPPRERRALEAPQAEDEVRLEAQLTFSDRERLQGRDFESMSNEEFARARELVEQLPLPVRPVVTRRRVRGVRGALDLRAALRRIGRDPMLLAPPRSAPRRVPPPLVLLCDISGSMDRYARILLHYAHALMRRYRRVRVFTFGTRLTDVSRHLRQRDPDQALAAAAQAVHDWNGGTRIGECLHDFNHHWARRVLTGNATLILVTDGLDREKGGQLAAEAAQLRRFAREVVWLNPLLRYEAFEPKAAGIRALLPHVDRFLPVHNLRSLADLRDALAPGPKKRNRGPH